MGIFDKFSNTADSPGSVLKKSQRKFAVLLVLLLTIMAIAPTAVIDYVINTAGAGTELDISLLLKTVVLLTAGFLFMAGGLGLWALRSSMEAEELTILGRFVNAMDFISDGMIILDSKGRIKGANPVARQWMDGEFVEKSHLTDYFPGIPDADVQALLDFSTHTEFEIEVHREKGPMTFRFRTQYEEGIQLVQISDVTQQKGLERRHRQEAQLQFIGKVARGVAHDFNNILCAITGHAALIERSGHVSDDDVESLQVISNEANRGASLARRLLDLGQNSEHQPGGTYSEQLRDMKELIGVAIPRGWDVTYAIEPMGVCSSMSSSQIEQIVVNLCLLTVESCPDYKHLMVCLEPDRRVNAKASRVSLTIYVFEKDESAPSFTDTILRDLDLAGGDGVLLSVVAGLVQEGGGRLYKLHHGDRDLGFRVDFIGPLDEQEPSTVPGPHEPWDDIRFPSPLLIARSMEPESDAFYAAMKRIAPRASICSDIPGFVEQLEKTSDWKLILMDEDMLDGQEDVMVRILKKLAPQAKLVVFTNSPDQVRDFTSSVQAFHLLKTPSFEKMIFRLDELIHPVDH